MKVKSLIRLKSAVFYMLIVLFLSKFTEVPEPYYPVVTEFCHTENTSFQIGEKIEYDLYYNWGLIWIPAGVVTFEVKEKNEFYEITAIGTTYPSYDSFFKVRDTFSSIIDKHSLLPQTFTRDIQEGKYILDSKIDFDQKNHTANSVVTKRGYTKNYKFEYAECMHDLLSILYFFRNLDYLQFEENNKLPVDLLLDSKVYHLTVSFDGIDERKKIKGLGRYNSLKYSLELIAGHIFKKGDKMKAWVTNDKNRIGLLIESPVYIGSIKAVLSRYSGLRYDFASKVK